MMETKTIELPIVRAVEPSDTDDIIAMLSRQHAEEGYPFAFSADRVRGYIRRAFDRETIVGVLGEPGSLKGSACVEFGQAWYSDDWAMHEIWTYVLPEFRASRCARALINCMKGMERVFGVPLVASITSSVRTEAKVRLYRRAYGDPVGAVFLHSSNQRA